MHLNDSKTPFASHRDRHELIGEGSLGEIAFRNIMNDERFAHMPKVIETPKGDRPYRDGCADVGAAAELHRVWLNWRGPFIRAAHHQHERGRYTQKMVTIPSRAISVEHPCAWITVDSIPYATMLPIVSMSISGHVSGTSSAGSASYNIVVCGTNA